MDKRAYALSYVRGRRIRIATVIQSEAHLHAVYGRELVEAFVDNHRARVVYRPPAHRRDLAEQISKIVGQNASHSRSSENSGIEPVREWLKELDTDDRRMVGNDLQAVEYGWPIGLPFCRSRKSHKGLWEVRSDLSCGRIARVLFCVTGVRMVLPHAHGACRVAASSARGLGTLVILLLGVSWRLLARQFQEQPQSPAYGSRVTKRACNIGLQEHDSSAVLVCSVMLALYCLREVVLGAHAIVCLWRGPRKMPSMAFFETRSENLFRFASFLKRLGA
jgi:hypothetical protein